MRRRAGIVLALLLVLTGCTPAEPAGPAAEPPTRAEPVCFDAVETACGPYACGLQGFSGGGSPAKGVDFFDMGLTSRVGGAIILQK